MGGPKKCCTGTEEDLYSIFCCCATRVGSMFFLCTRPDGYPSLVVGPCWPFCLFFTVPLICSLAGLTLYFCIIQSDLIPTWLAYLYVPLIIITLLALGGVSCRDPGLLERVSEEDKIENAFLWNEQTGSYRPPDALYCRECKVSNDFVI